MSFRFALPAACVLLGATAAQAQTPPTLTSDIKGAEAATAGSVMLTEAPRGVLVRIQVKGLPAGWHGMHFHEKGDCSPPTFTTAGGHVHGAGTLIHGLLNPDATDAGDLPNLYVAADGTATVELYSTLVSFAGAGGRPALRGPDGTALVIHANPDDYKTQPIGGAGARIACAVIK